MKRLFVMLTAILAVLALTSAAPAGAATRFDRELQSRIARAQAYADSRPGDTGIVLRDRWTGAVYRSQAAGTLIWACSTPKLAMVVDLLLRNDSGAVQLTAEDRDLIHRMLNSSDDAAAHTLWTRYGGEAEFAKRFPSYGMTDMRFTDQHPHHWGWILTTANDLDRLVNYVLTELPRRHRDYIVREMRTVDVNQQWGGLGRRPRRAPRQQERLVRRQRRRLLDHELGRFRRPARAIHPVAHEQHQGHPERLRNRPGDHHEDQRDPVQGILQGLTGRLTLTLHNGPSSPSNTAFDDLAQAPNEPLFP